VQDAQVERLEESERSTMSMTVYDVAGSASVLVTKDGAGRRTASWTCVAKQPANGKLVAAISRVTLH
jgi:hypothetical protein